MWNTFWFWNFWDPMIFGGPLKKKKKKIPQDYLQTYRRHSEIDKSLRSGEAARLKRIKC